MNKLLLIIRLKLTVGPLYIVALLEIIKMTKIIFINELKSGNEVCIPDRLLLNYSKKDQQPQLPLSLQFYDYIYTYVRNSIDEKQLKKGITEL